MDQQQTVETTTHTGTARNSAMKDYRPVTSTSDKKIIVEGITEAGRKFRPSDWAERMSGALSTFGRDHRIQYSPMLQPMTLNGIKCIVLDPEMKQAYPEMYAYIMGWAKHNQLKVAKWMIAVIMVLLPLASSQFIFLFTISLNKDFSPAASSRHSGVGRNPKFIGL